MLKNWKTGAVLLILCGAIPLISYLLDFFGIVAIEEIFNFSCMKWITILFSIFAIIFGIYTLARYKK